MPTKKERKKTKPKINSSQVYVMNINLDISEY